MIIIYGDVELHYETARTCEYRAVYSPDGADFLYYHFRIGAVCEVHHKATGGIASMGDAIESLSRIMLEPGQRLTVADDAGNVFVDSPEGLGETATTVSGGKREGYYDCNQGPKPIAFEVLEMRGTQSAKVYFEVETWIKRCPGRMHNKAAQPPVLYHRWEEHHSINELLYTTRTIYGEVRFRSDVLRRLGHVPDDFRDLLFPHIPHEFRRMDINVYTSKDGLTLYYVTKDVQQSRPLARELFSRGVEKVEASVSTGFRGFFGLGKVWNVTVEAWARPGSDVKRIARYLTEFLDDLPGVLGAVFITGVLDYGTGLVVNLKDFYVKAEVSFMAAWGLTPLLNDVEDAVDTATGGAKPLFAGGATGEGRRHTGTYLGKILHQVLKNPCATPKTHARNPHDRTRRLTINDDAHKWEVIEV